jgi:DNA-binding transcriptional ArsR family regulator
MSQAKNRTPLTPEQLGDIAGLFKILGEPMRLRILQAVCHGPRSVGEIVVAADSTQANVSKHLALLTAAGILRREKDGQRVLYQVKNDLAVKLCELVRAQLDE